MENLPKKKTKANKQFFYKYSWWLGGEGEVRIKSKQDDPEGKFQAYRGNNLYYDMLCEPIGSDKNRKREIISAVIILST